MNDSVTIAELWIYPVKSCAGISLKTVNVLREGFQGDRQWMIVDPSGRFITQRQYPQLACVQAQLNAETLTLSYPERSPLKISREQQGDLRAVTVWRSTLEAIDQGEEVAHWLSTVLKTPARLVRLSPEHPRLLNPKYALWDNHAVSFADGYPVLLTNTASAQSLSEKLGETVAMNRFRPNLVVDCPTPFAEDRWQSLGSPGLGLVTAKPCDRCVVITTDQQTGDRHPQQEPLRTLGQFRRTSDGILFGINLMPTGTGQLAVGDVLSVIPRED